MPCKHQYSFMYFILTGKHKCTKCNYEFRSPLWQRIIGGLVLLYGLRMLIPRIDAYSTILAVFAIPVIVIIFNCIWFALLSMIHR